MSIIYSPEQIAVAAESWKYWKGVGLDDVHAAAWLGNEDGETSFNPRAIGDRGEAFGPAQDHLMRVLAIKQGCGIDIRTAPHLDQLEAIFWEVSQGTYKHVWTKVKATETLQAAVAILVQDYEQSGDQTRDIARRTVLATYWLGQFGSNQ
ncbi:MAG TPA: phage tail tip lysozyme [Methylocella sp.]|nr:phage tail tip lysozyme [Methylocella sp.]